MKNQSLSLTYPGFFTSELMDHTIFLKFSGNFFQNCTSFDKKDYFLGYLNDVASVDTIKSVIIYSAYSETGQDEYLKFFLSEKPSRPLGLLDFLGGMDNLDLNRYCNFIDQFVLSLIQMEKFIIHICSGNVFSQILNIMLACDYRIISNDTSFHNLFQEIGTIPKGGGIYFMEKLIGHTRTKELLLFQSKITAEMALDAGLVDQVVDIKKIEQTALFVAEKIKKIPQSLIAGVKRLITFQVQGFENYLEMETREVNRMAILVR